jgi:WD40 repeat protein
LNSFKAEFNANGNQCAIMTDKAIQVHTFHRPSGRREFNEDLGPRLYSAAFSADGQWLAASATQRLGLWDLRVQEPGVLSTAGADARLFFSSSGELLASAAEDGFRWRLAPGKNSATSRELQLLPLPQKPGFTSLCSFLNQVVLTGTDGSRILSLSPKGAVETDHGLTGGGVTRASPDGRWLGLFQPYGRSLSIYRLPAFEEVASLTNHSSIISFEFSPQGDELAVSSLTGVALWSTETWRCTRELADYVSLIYSPRGRTWWLTKDYQSAGLYDSRTLELLLPLPSGTLPLAVSPDGRNLAASVDMRHLQLWDLDQARASLKESGLGWPE